MCVCACVSASNSIIGPNPKWDTVQIHQRVISRWSNAARKAAHRQCYCMSMRPRWFTWDLDHDLITLKWTNIEKKYLELSYILILIISAPEGSKHTHTHIKWKQRSVSASPPLCFLLTEISLSWCGGVQKKKKKKRKGKIARGTWQRIWPVPLQSEAERKKTHFPTLAIFRFKDWKVKRCTYRWKPSSLNM